MTIRLAQFSCGLCLTAILTSQSLPAQEPVQNPAEPNALQAAPAEPPAALPFELGPDVDVKDKQKSINYLPVTASSLQDRLDLPATLSESPIYPELKADLDKERRENRGFRAVEPPANWHAIGNPFATIQAPLEPLTHNPLYFEEPLAERYGYVYSDCVQPFASASHFYLRVPLLSLQMLVTPPRSLVTPNWPQIVDPAFEYDR